LGGSDLEKEHGVHVFDIGELQNYLKKSGYAEFKYNIHGSIMLFKAKKI
jgi:hypothetical protein